MENLLRYTGKDLQDLTMEQWLMDKSPELRPLAIEWMDEIKSCGADVQHIFHDGYPMGCVEHAPFAYVNVFTYHVNVGFFYGVDLPDKNKLLEGSGKRMRHIKLKPGTPIPAAEIRNLIKASYVDIKKRLSER